jgi:hypothetical protein
MNGRCAAAPFLFNRRTAKIVYINEIEVFWCADIYFRRGDRAAEGAALERQKANPHETLHSLVFIRPNPPFTIYENLPIYVHSCAFAAVMTTGKKLSRKVTVSHGRDRTGPSKRLAGSLRLAS